MGSCSKSMWPWIGSRYLKFGFRARHRGIWEARRALLTGGKLDRKAIEKLPLAGIRVLDMTRVLAGVGHPVRA
jgi:hypothetical protein